MKWSDIAPQGTAAWANAWRRRYRSMPFSQHQSDTDAIMMGHAVPNTGHLIDSRDLRLCLHSIDCSGMDVVEFGGWRGAMAQSVLSRFPQLYSWTSYDICPSALIDSECDDIRYRCFVHDKFLWETPRTIIGGNIFCSSHAIEHLTAEHLNLLFRWLPDSIKWIYLCAPIQDSTTTEDWKDYGGTHILEVGWEQVLAMLPDFKLVDSGEQFRWLERK